MYLSSEEVERVNRLDLDQKARIVELEASAEVLASVIRAGIQRVAEHEATIASWRPIVEHTALTLPAMRRLVNAAAMEMACPMCMRSQTLGHAGHCPIGEIAVLLEGPA
jgi:hypothetical protein